MSFPDRPAHVEVAVGVLTRDDGAVLLARRPASKVYAGYWEFPGGKLEPGESAHDALARELGEELGINVGLAYRWITQEFTYPHARVRLNFFRVTAWSGELRTLEHDGMSWEQPGSVSVAPLLPANGPVLRGLALPHEYAITHCVELGMDAQLRCLKDRLDAGLRLMQVREPGMPAAHLEDFLRRVVALARPRGARVLVNADIALARRTQADGVHLTARQIAALDARPDLPLVGASCHDLGERHHAERLGADFAVLGSVLPTRSHPDIAPMGWERFETVSRGASLPLFALGGLSPGDLETAWRRGAHGIAMQRAAWR
ncbi:MAG: Nudix family hydrolase [Betaproteobacteria bacterium]|nr:Nudix family hydrolase [Betaproteobacteria bacterium]